MGFRKWSWRLEVHICDVLILNVVHVSCSVLNLFLDWKIGWDVYILGGGSFFFLCIFTPTWGRFPFWLIFSKWVETTNQHIMFTVYCLLGMLVIQWCHWHHNSVTKDYTSCFQLWYISLQIWISPNWASLLKQDSPEFTYWCLFDLAVL